MKIKAKNSRKKTYAAATSDWAMAIYLLAIASGIWLFYHLGLFTPDTEFTILEYGNINKRINDPFEGEYRLTVVYRTDGNFCVDKPIHIKASIVPLNDKVNLDSVHFDLHFPEAFEFPPRKGIFSSSYVMLPLYIANRDSAFNEGWLFYRSQKPIQKTIFVPFDTQGNHSFNLMINRKYFQNPDNFSRLNTMGLTLGPPQFDNKLAVSLSIFGAYCGLTALIINLRRRSRKKSRKG